jgi:hypothetical protein
MEDMAIVMRLKVSKVERLTSQLLAAKLLDRDDAGTLRPHGWESRQLRGDDSAAIKRNQRDKHKKKRGQTSECPPVVHGQSTECPRLDSDDDEYVIKTQTTDETKSPPPPSNGIVELFTLNPDHAALIEAARSAFGDQFADTVAEMGRDIQDTLSGRWDCYAAAMKSAKRSAKPIDNLHLYCLRTGEKFTRNGIPPEPVASKPSANGRHAEKPAPEPPVHRAPADSPHRNRVPKPEPTS